MSPDAANHPHSCNYLALRQAARHVTQFYDQRLAPSGLRTTQFSILAKLKFLGPMTINHLGQLPAVTISFNLAPGVALGQAGVDLIVSKTVAAIRAAQAQGGARH